MKRFAIWAVLISATAPLASARVLVEIAVADVADFEALRGGREERFVFVGRHAYTAVDDGALAGFDAGGRAWSGVAVAVEEEVFLVLPAAAAYDGPRLATGELAGGNRFFVLTAADAAALAPLYAFNVVYLPRGRPGVALPAAPFNPLEAGAAERVRRDKLMATAERLQDFYSRYVYFHGNDAATAFLEDEYRKVLRAAVDRQYFEVVTRRGSKNAANVVARIDGVKYPDQQIVVGAHFDSAVFGSVGNPRAAAPGADDDASGTAAVLECARILSGYAFDRTLIFIGFNAEELGLFGSIHYATTARARGDDIKAMINLDMVAYEADAVLDATAGANGPSYEIAELMATKAARYTSVKMVPNGSGAGGSDHVSFWGQGYKAVIQSEGWNDSSPYIHTDGDTVDTLNPSFFADMARILVATAFDLAGPNTSPLMGIVDPDGGDYADAGYVIRWWDVDVDDLGRDAAISLYWAKDNGGESGTLIASGIPQNDRGNRGSYEWNTSSLPAGRYYVYGVIEDGVNEPYTAPSAGPVRIIHAPRVVAYPNPARWRAGQTEVTFDGLFPGDGLVVFDVSGTKVFEAAAEGRQLRWDVADVASGVYLFRVESAVMADAVTGKVAVLR
ncbi:MAG: M28 family peptidase [bacterium]